MINNYKAQRNVRAELGGAVDLGEPVSLYIKEDEVAVASKNLITNGKYNVDADPLWLTGTDGNGVEGWSISGGKATKSAPAANSGIEQSNIFENGKTYQVNFTISDRTQGSIAVYRGQGTQLIYSSGSSSMNDSHSIIITSTTNAHKILFNGTGNFDGSIDNVSVYEVLDHTYKLMAVNDKIPARSVNTEAMGPNLFDANKGTFTNGSNELRIGSEITSGTLSDNTWYEISAQNSVDFTAVGAPNNNVGTVFCLTTATASAPTMTSNDKVYEIDLSWITTHEGKLHLDSNALVITGGSGTTSPAQLLLSDAADLNQDLVVGRTYKVDFEIKMMSSGNGRLKIIDGAGNSINGTATSSTTFVEDSIIFTAAHATNAKISASGVDDTPEIIAVDNITIKEVYGYDYYNAPAYKFGIVSSVYDQSTGAMKTSGVAGDEIDVTVQGECTLHKSGTYSLGAGRILALINEGSALESFTPSSSEGDYALPNSVGVTSETTSSSNTQPIILWQGVEFSEHFVHKNSLQVMAKCDETITKFRPVSLFLDSNGDLLCRHDDIPEEQVLLNTDYTGVDPGKWGVAELGGVSGELIPVTVAGKTTFKTDNSVPYRNAGDLITRLSEGGWLATTTTIAGFAPNALGTVMEGGGAGDEVPITIFQGTPIGTITDWKRTIKVTAKARGTVPQYRPVSLYLDENGNYRCTVDGIPRTSTDSNNGVWCDFRKWGIAQEAAVDGENVEIIVQGRTRVKDTSTNANRGEFVTKISSSGDVTSGDALGLALSSLGIIEKESKLSDGEPGVIIIF